jgi:hypothetical protein
LFQVDLPQLQLSACLPPPSRPRQHDIVNIVPGPKNVPAGASKLEVFQLFFPVALVRDVIAHWTNAWAQHAFAALNAAPGPQQRMWKPVDETELYALFGILLRAGVDRASDVPLRELWATHPEKVRVLYPAALSRDQTLELLAFLRFDDAFQRRANPAAAKRLHTISLLFDPVNLSFRSHFEPGIYLTVDEMLVSFRGNCRFCVYMKSKPGRYGLKIWAIVDSETGYILNLQVQNSTFCFLFLPFGTIQILVGKVLSLFFIKIYKGHEGNKPERD